MGVAKFPLPAAMQETIDLINASDQYNLRLSEQNGEVDLVFGDQLLFTAYTQQEAEAFLAGFFPSTFSGNSL